MHGSAEPAGPAGPGEAVRGASLPIFPAAVYAFPDLASTLAGFEGVPPGRLYSRYGHPTGLAVEARLAAVARAEAALLFSSGMAAIALSLLTLCRSGDHLLATADVYGGTSELFAKLLPAAGIEVEQVPLDEVPRLGARVRDNTRAIFVESPTNPLLRLVDFDALLAGLRTPRPALLLDATFATPIGHRGAIDAFDVVLHSATKYIGGHDDLLAGVATGKAATLRGIAETRRMVGAMCDPQTAWLVERGLKTLAVRWERQCANALELARRLTAHPRIIAVHHPGLPSHPQHETARRQMTAFGGMLTFEVEGGMEGATRAFDALRLVLRAPSLGGVESTVMHPATASHRYIPAEARRAIGIGDGLLRLSVGIEDVEDLWADLSRALS